PVARAPNLSTNRAEAATVISALALKSIALAKSRKIRGPGHAISRRARRDPLMAARILVVDDEPDVEPLLSQGFRRRIRAGELSRGFEGEGEAALNRLRADPGFDVVLTDINMPRMDGLTLLGHLQSFIDLRAVIMSAYGDMDNIRTAMNRGAFDFITKPIDFA